VARTACANRLTLASGVLKRDARRWATHNCHSIAKPSLTVCQLYFIAAETYCVPRPLVTYANVRDHRSKSGDPLPLRSIPGPESHVESKRNGRHGAGPLAQGRQVEQPGALDHYTRRCEAGRRSLAVNPLTFTNRKKRRYCWVVAPGPEQTLDQVALASAMLSISDTNWRCTCWGTAL
jgi:hypothetical protein